LLTSRIEYLEDVLSCEQDGSRPFLTEAVERWIVQIWLPINHYADPQISVSVASLRGGGGHVGFRLAARMRRELQVGTQICLVCFIGGRFSWKVVKTV
jgi:hypothetical protein